MSSDLGELERSGDCGARTIERWTQPAVIHSRTPHGASGNVTSRAGCEESPRKYRGLARCGLAKQRHVDEALAVCLLTLEGLLYVTTFDGKKAPIPYLRRRRSSNGFQIS